jgi:hypothetical protein
MDDVDDCLEGVEAMMLDSDVNQKGGENLG